MQTLVRIFVGFTIGTLLGGSVELRAADAIDFSRDISPILSKKCFQCHGPDEGHRKGDLRLDKPDALDGPFADHDGYQAIVPGNLEKSDLWYRVTTDDEDDLMPPEKSNLAALTDNEKALIKQWIEEGGKYDTFWAFIPPARRDLPVVDSERWGQSAIDRFIMDRLIREGLTPNPRADRRTLIRRLSLDLTGLPPTREEIQAFLEDTSDTAYEDLVDRLLGSPRYGEHMAKYWLDLVRFADTNGLHHDHYRDMSPYREWVIRAFNENLGYDDFSSYQIAGDLYESPSTDQLVASGFNRLHLVIDVGTALPEESYTRNVMDRVTAFGTAFMGLSVQCASCHDHKFDPVTMKDFYQLFAFFNNFDGEPETGGRNGLDFKRGLQKPYIELPSPQQSAQLEAYDQEIQSVESKIKDREETLAQAAEKTEQANEEGKPKKQTDPDIETWKKELDRLKKERDEVQMAVPAALVMKEREEIRPAYMLKRGNYDQLGDVVQRDTPGFLPPMKSGAEHKTRRDLARWVVDPSNPLTARVAVNRFWQQCFGIGLVKTSEDFGAQGERPSHAGLLDYLAMQFIESGWDIKQLMRTIVLSETYQQSSVITPEKRAKDPENRLLARGARFRMDSEMIRDHVLMVSGLLNLEIGGKSVKPPQPAKLWEIVAMPYSYPRVYEPDQGKKAYRRSVYTFWKRALPPPQMSIFDAPTREACIARRERTNTPLQALLMMNEPEYFRAAAATARQLLSRNGLSDQERIQVAYESITSRQPGSRTTETLKQALDGFRQLYAQDNESASTLIAHYVGDGVEDVQVGELAAWTMLTHSLFNLDIVKTRQ